MKEELFFTLKEISEWVKPGSLVDIPISQRGLVWKPRKVELLWDSLLRGFPIGSFMLSDVADGQSDAKYYLMDGQQRFNAIRLGFNNERNANAMLWIDVNPPVVKGSTRVYWVRATTEAHPLRQTWPYFAKCPIPLFLFLSASIETQEDFVRDIMNGFDSFCPSPEYKKQVHIGYNEYSYIRNKLYDTFIRLKEYKVGCWHLSVDLSMLL